MQVEEEEEESERAIETAQNDSITGPNLIASDPSKDLLEILTQVRSSLFRYESSDEWVIEGGTSFEFSENILF